MVTVRQERPAEAAMLSRHTRRDRM